MRLDPPAWHDGRRHREVGPPLPVGALHPYLRHSGAPGGERQVGAASQRVGEERVRSRQGSEASVREGDRGLDRGVQRVNAKPVDLLHAHPLGGLERKAPKLEAGALELRAQEVRLGHLAHLVPGPGDLLGLRPERLEPLLEPQLAPDEAQFQIGPLDLAHQSEPHPLERGLADAELGLGHVLAESSLPGPGQRHIHQHLPEAGGLNADLDAVEAVVLDAEDQRRVGQRASLGHALALGGDVGQGAGMLRAVGERCVDQRGQKSVAGVGLEDGGNGPVVTDGCELKQDETEKRGHVGPPRG